MNTRTSELDTHALAELRVILERTRIDNERDIDRATSALSTMTADNTMASSSLREIAGNADYMIADARAIITLIDRALERMDNGTYGSCAVCEQPIPLARLEVRPYGTTCVPCSA